MRDVGVGQNARFAEEEVASTGGSETSFFGEGGGEDMDGKGAAKLGDVSVGVSAMRERSAKYNDKEGEASPLDEGAPLDLVVDEDREDCVRRRGPHRDRHVHDDVHLGIYPIIDVLLILRRSPNLWHPRHALQPLREARPDGATPARHRRMRDVAMSVWVSEGGRWSEAGVGRSGGRAVVHGGE